MRAVAFAKFACAQSVAPQLADGNSLFQVQLLTLVLQQPIGEINLYVTTVTCSVDEVDMHLDRRSELLERIVDELLTSGAGDLSLRPLAERAGTSARLLIYHFQSKDQLIAIALTEARDHIQSSPGARAAELKPQSLRALVMMCWDWATDAANQRYFRLLFEVDGLAMFDRATFSDDARRANSAIGTQLIERAAATSSPEGDLFAAHSTLIMCALSGLLQEFLSTDDRKNTTAALLALLDLVAADAHATSPSQGRKR